MALGILDVGSGKHIVLVVFGTVQIAEFSPVVESSFA